MTSMNFSSANDDIGEPAGGVFRVKDTGEIDLTIVPGDDERVNKALYALAKIIELKGFDAFIESAKASIEGSGMSLDDLLKPDDIIGE